MKSQNLSELSETKKYNNLLNILCELESVAVAFSGGVDSTFLLAAAKEALGTNVIGVIGRSPTYPKKELEEAIELAKKIDVTYEIVDTNEMSLDKFCSNSTDRCFWCKTTLFDFVKNVAKKHGIKHVIEGSNADDVGDFRPGMKAAEKLDVKSPLKDAKLSKKEIRKLSLNLNLPTWDKPAMACLSSRIPYGKEINLDKLKRIESTEANLKSLGLVQLRVRDHEQIARIELDTKDIPRILDDEFRYKIVKIAKDAGYKYVSLDLEGYRTGSMNEVIGNDSK